MSHSRNAILTTLFGLLFAASSEAAGTYSFETGADGVPVFAARLDSGAAKTDREAFDLYFDFALSAKGVRIDGRRFKRRSLPSPDAENFDLSCFKPASHAKTDSFCTMRFRASPSVQVDLASRILIAHFDGAPAYALFEKLHPTSTDAYDWLSRDGKMRWRSTPESFDFYASDSQP